MGSCSSWTPPHLPLVDPSQIDAAWRDWIAHESTSNRLVHKASHGRLRSRLLPERLLHLAILFRIRTRLLPDLRG